ncbi:MmgE/PrpD family protein [Chloroflexota bacterium]
MTASVKSQEDASLIFARHIVSAGYNDLPPEVIDITKKCILDIMGVVLAASGTVPDAKVLADLIKESSGREESTILGFGDKVPAWNAGYLNGAMSHCLDYDDLYVPGGGHISGPVIPSVIALAERLGKVTGKKFINAVALGMDMFCRLGHATPESRLEWVIIPIFGVFGATAACGKLLDLDEQQLTNALGIAFLRAAGTMEVIYGLDSNIRGMYNAAPGEEGVRASLMAQRGITGVKNSLEGRFGLFNNYFHGKYDRSALLGELGKRFPAINIGFKPWPSNGTTHVYIEIALDIAQKHNLNSEDIEGVTVTVGDFAREFCEPLSEKQNPRTTMNAKLSIPFTVALALAQRKVGIGDFLPQNLSNPKALNVSQLVNYQYDPDYAINWAVGEPPGKVEVRTRDGQTYSQRSDIAYGHFKNPMSWDSLIEKFRDCASYSAKPIAKESVEQAIHMTTNLEGVNDVSEIIQLLS